MLKVEMVEKKANTRSLKVEVPQEQVDKEFARVTAEIRNKVAMPGFRPGKVPTDIIKKNYEQKIKAEVFDRLFSSSYSEALNETNSIPIESPKLDKADLVMGQPFNYQVTVGVLPKVKLGNYKGLKLKGPKIKVSSEEIMQVLAKLQDDHAIIEKCERKIAEDKDVVTVDFTGSQDGEILPEAKAEDYAFQLGSGQTIKDFDENIKGMTLDETKKFTAKFPKDYHAKKMAGKSIEFEVKLKLIQTKKLPELNDDFAKKLANVDTLDKFKDIISESIEKKKQEDRYLILKEQINQNLIKTSQVEVPEVLLKRSLDNLEKQHKADMAKQNQSDKEVSINSEEFAKQNKLAVERNIKTQLITREIGETEKLVVSEEEMEKEISKIAISAHQPREKVREFFIKNNKWEDIRERLREEKVYKMIIAEAKVVEN